MASPVLQYSTGVIASESYTNLLTAVRRLALVDPNAKGVFLADLEKFRAGLTRLNKSDVEAMYKHVNTEWAKYLVARAAKKDFAYTAFDGQKTTISYGTPQPVDDDDDEKKHTTVPTTTVPRTPKSGGRGPSDDEAQCRREVAEVIRAMASQELGYEMLIANLVQNLAKAVGSPPTEEQKAVFLRLKERTTALVKENSDLKKIADLANDEARRAKNEAGEHYGKWQADLQLSEKNEK